MNDFTLVEFSYANKPERELTISGFKQKSIFYVSFCIAQCKARCYIFFTFKDSDKIFVLEGCHSDEMASHMGVI